jgi:ribosomal protein S2
MTKKTKKLIQQFKTLDPEAQERVIRRMEKQGEEEFARALTKLKRSEGAVERMKNISTR